MDVQKNVDVKSLFERDVQYIIPIFQRHYVWTEEEQWEPLWKDISERSDQRLPDPQGKGFTHFTGAIVVQLQHVIGVKKYEIIDGQQRLTTFQLILCALRDVCKLYNFERIEKESERHILNQGGLSENSDDERYKLMPTKFDRSAFISLVDRHMDDSNGNIYSTYDYFKNKIETYVNHDRNKMLALYSSILYDFGFVLILLDPPDEAEKIFESLNARGKPLLRFDLLRNNLFLRARRDERDENRLYAEYWGHFEHPYWEKEVQVGRSKVILSERFLEHFLMAKTGMENVTPLFNVYQRMLVGNNEVEHELSELKKYSEVYQELINCNPDSEIGSAMLFYETFKISTVHPFILFLINELEVSGQELAEVLQVLESYTMRRLLCIRGAAQSYTQHFSRWIRRLKEKGFNLRCFIKGLSEEQTKATKWPTDSEVKTFLNVGNAGGVKKAVLRYILYRIELMKREKNQYLETDKLTFDDKLSLEHIMPEAWRKTWPLLLSNAEQHKSMPRKDMIYEDLFTDEYKRENREWEDNPSLEGLKDESYHSAFRSAQLRIETLQSIGNLTLITKRHNSKLSNRSFAEKKASLGKNSNLILNKEICDGDTWETPQIQERTNDLFTYFCLVWPSAENFIGKLT